MLAGLIRRSRQSTLRRMASVSSSVANSKRNAAEQTKKDAPSSARAHHIVDDPCWGSPTACSLSHLLARIDRESSILFESKDYLVLNKPPDLRMDGPYPSTVHKLLTYWYPPLSLIEKNNLLESISDLHQHNDIDDNELRPCHQLDYATSGVLLVARSQKAANRARHAFESRTAKKKYVALLHGHVSQDLIEQAEVVPTEREVQARMEELEDSYRKARCRQRNDTFVGYQPPHALFQRWQQQTRLPESNSWKKKRKKSLLTDDDWRKVWAALDNEFLSTMTNASWKDVKTSASHLAAFESATVTYNHLLRARMEASESAVLSEPTPLPTIFEVKEDMDRSSFYICASLAESADEFSMFITPKLREQIHQDVPLRAGSDELDYKPALTKCTIQCRGYIRHKPGNSASYSAPVTKVCLEPRTGRRHQLRVHAALIGHSIVGDHTYPQRKKAAAEAASPRMCLHAQMLEMPCLLGDRPLIATTPDRFVENDNEIRVDCL